MKKDMTVTYVVDGALYVNVTNRCTNNCDFCIRKNGDGAYGSDSLWLEREPTEDEILDAVFSRDLSKYSELVFCGYGEPTERLDVLIAAAKYIRSVSDIKIRLNTNGLASLSNGKDVPKLLEGLIDVMSVSMNAPTAEEYLEVSNPCFGLPSFEAMLAFVKECKGLFPKVMVTAVDVLSDDQAARCQELADSIGVPFRLREFS